MNRTIRRVIAALGVAFAAVARADDVIDAAAAEAGVVETSGIETLIEQGLPPGGALIDGRIRHTVQKGQSLGWLASRYLKFTDYYTTGQLAKAIERDNGLTRAWLAPGQEIVLPPPRSIPLSARTVPRDRSTPFHGVYVTMTSAGSERILSLVRQLKPAGLNAVVIDIKDMDGVIAYPTAVPLARAIGAAERGTIRDLPKLINLLHAEGIHVIARQVVFYDRYVAQQAPHLALQSTGGGPWRQHNKQVWADPAHPEVQDYNLAIAREAVSLGIDEIQFDYIRFPAEGDTGSIAYSFDIATTPKHEIITGFLKRAKETLAPMGALVSLDVYGVVAWDEKRDVEITGQRLEDLGRYADAISPMLYPSHFYPPFDGHNYPAWEPYYFVHQGVLKSARKIGDGGAVVRPWLQAFPYKVKHRYGPDYVTAQLLASDEVGGLGYLLWNAQNDYDVGLKGMELWNSQKDRLAEIKAPE
jgi:hypothetical protein